MKVYCDIINDNPRGFIGLIKNLAHEVIFETGHVGCAEDADGELTRVILNRKYEVLPRDEVAE